MSVWNSRLSHLGQTHFSWRMDIVLFSTYVPVVSSLSECRCRRVRHELVLPFRIQEAEWSPTPCKAGRDLSLGQDCHRPGQRIYTDCDDERSPPKTLATVAAFDRFGSDQFGAVGGNTAFRRAGPFFAPGLADSWRRRKTGRGPVGPTGKPSRNQLHPLLPLLVATIALAMPDRSQMTTTGAPIIIVSVCWTSAGNSNVGRSIVVCSPIEKRRNCPVPRILTRRDHRGFLDSPFLPRLNPPACEANRNETIHHRPPRIARHPGYPKKQLPPRNLRIQGLSVFPFCKSFFAQTILQWIEEISSQRMGLSWVQSRFGVIRRGGRQVSVQLPSGSLKLVPILDCTRSRIPLAWGESHNYTKSAFRSTNLPEEPQ